MKRFALALVIAGFAIPATAAIWTFNDPLSWNQEVPPATGSQGTGLATGIYDDATNILTFSSMSVSNLLGTMTASHIHTGAVGVNGPIIVNLPTFGSWSGTGPNATYVQTSPIVLTSAQEAQFLAGGTYINIHTTRLPGGEVRGQLNPVPEPASLVALGAALAALAARRRGRSSG
jgi:hypothetical protein